jgi:hypothetical protein
MLIKVSTRHPFHYLQNPFDVAYRDPELGDMNVDISIAGPFIRVCFRNGVIIGRGRCLGELEYRNFKRTPIPVYIAYQVTISNLSERKPHPFGL